MHKKWRIAAHDVDEVRALQRTSGLPALVSQLLICRGIRTANSAETFLNPKLTGLRAPEELPGTAAAVELIVAAIAAEQRIIVYGDYDVDGISGTSILVRCLKLIGGDVGYYLPNRLDEGYGLHSKALQKLAADGASLVITVDCGITSVGEAEVARELGLKLVITDHHTLADQLPNADAVVHPQLPGHDYPFAGLCGAGVAFKLAWALCQHVYGAKRVSPAMREFLLQAVGLAALGTVADVVPLVDENRILVHHGLASLYQRPVAGTAELMRMVGIDKNGSLSSEDIGFSLGPRLNAAGRLGQAPLAVELLTTTNVQRAAALAEYLHELNKSRESLERSVYLAANKQASSFLDADPEAALVLAGHGWHCGVIGIVAGRLAEKYARPVLLVALDETAVKPGLGSARSVPGLSMVAGLRACHEYLISHGGHHAAAGFKVEEKQLDAFRNAFREYLAENFDPSEHRNELRIDAEVPFSTLTLNAVEQIERLAPFGQANPRPLLCTSGVELAAPPKLIGSGGRHLALQLSQYGVRLRGVAFGGGEWSEKLSATGGPLSFAYRPVINTFRGRRSVEIHVDDWQDDAGTPGQAAAAERATVS